MQDKQVFHYAFIRFVPRVERGEFINVGVILHCKRKRFLQAKFHIDESRLKALFSDINIPELAKYLDTWDLIATGSEGGGAIAKLDSSGRFGWLTATRSTIIQSSKVHPGICDDPEKALENLFEKYIKN